MESSLGVLSPTSDIRVVEHEQTPIPNNTVINAFIMGTGFLICIWIFSVNESTKDFLCVLTLLGTRL